MRTLITGGAGFIGSHLALDLIRAGEEVEVIDDLSISPHDHAGLLEAHGVVVHRTSILHPEVPQLVAAFAPTHVYHLAANSDIRAVSRSSMVDFERTLQTTVALCEALRGSNTSWLCFASSSAVYGERNQPLTEDLGALRPISYYGAAKLASEAWLSSFSRDQSIPVSVFRFANIVGPRATHGVIFDFIRKLRNDHRTLRVLGNGLQSKPFLHVEDLIRALHMVRDSAPRGYQVWNVGPRDTADVRYIAETIVARMGGTALIEYGEADRGWPTDVPCFQFDCGRLEALGWAAEATSRESLSRAISEMLEDVR